MTPDSKPQAEDVPDAPRKAIRTDDAEPDMVPRNLMDAFNDAADPQDET